MIEERIKYLIEKRNEKTKELNNLKSQREKNVVYTTHELHGTANDIGLESTIKLLERSIASINEALEMSKLLLSASSDTINLGTTFAFSLDNGFSKTVTLVNKLVSDEKNDFITDKSPLGAAVVGKMEGDLFSYMTPTGQEINGVINKVYKKEKMTKTR